MTTRSGRGTRAFQTRPGDLLKLPLGGDGNPEIGEITVTPGGTLENQAFSSNVAIAPEPSALWLLGSGMMLFCGYRLRTVRRRS
jgi:energy-converting hydrogenase Eha subunit B